MRNILKIVFLFGFFAFVSHSVKANDKIDRFAEVVDSLHSSIVFPHNIAPGIVLTNVGVDKNERLLVVNYLLNPELVESIINNASSENGIAQLLSGYDEIFAISMIDADAGYRVMVTSPSADGLNQSRFATVPSSDIAAVYSKLKSGDSTPLKPYLEMLQTSFDNMQFPFKIVNGIYIIKGFINDKEANWVYRVEGNLDSSSFTDEIIQHNRMNLINGIRKTLSEDYLKEIEEKGITLHYTYLNENFDVLYELIFTADDLKNQ